MLRKIMFLTISLLSFSRFAATISGDFGSGYNELFIEKNNQGRTHIKGAFLDRVYDFYIFNDQNETKMLGVLDGVERDLVFESRLGITQINDRLNTLSLMFDNREFGAFVSGRYTNHSATIRIDRTERKATVTGFYANHLNDLRILKNDNGLQFHGYVNGYWTDVIITSSVKHLNIEGRLMNKRINYKVEKEAIAIDDLLEFVVFGFYLPQVVLF